MNGAEELAQSLRRLEELAIRADKTGRPCFSGFLSPAEAERVESIARRYGLWAGTQGGYPDAECRMACFSVEEEESAAFPIAAVELTWPRQNAPEHRDILGSVMGLGLDRRWVGDIVLMPEAAYLFAEERMAEHIAQSLLSAGRVHLQTRLMEELPPLQPIPGEEVRDTVSSLRLDAVVAGGFRLSRGTAAELISMGRVKLRHLPEERPDARVAPGDAISVRGYGRLTVDAVGLPNRKGRLPLTMTRYGEHKKR